MLLVCICCYLKSVLRHKVLILDTYLPDTVFTWGRMWGSVVICRSPKGVREQKSLGNTAQRTSLWAENGCVHTESAMWFLYVHSGSNSLTSNAAYFTGVSQLHVQQKLKFLEIACGVNQVRTCWVRLWPRRCGQLSPLTRNQALGRLSRHWRSVHAWFVRRVGEVTNWISESLAIRN